MKRNSSTNPSAIQLTMFDPQDFADPRELPQIIAAKYVFTLTHIETDNGNMYAVQDWISGVAQTENTRRFWSDLRKRASNSGFELSDICGQLPYTATNGKTYQMDFANSDGLLQITRLISKYRRLNKLSELLTWESPQQFGYVYIVGMAKHPNIYKVGITTRPEARLHQYRTDNPFDCYYEFTLQSSQYEDIERAVQFALTTRLIAGGVVSTYY